MQSALLGAGAHGRVFLLTNKQVLKIVVGKNSLQVVEKEFKLVTGRCQYKDIQARNITAEDPLDQRSFVSLRFSCEI